ncbi:isochorismatase family protein [Aquibium sp. A9E412]|uniref:isochorismatase family protein n=1 Tax=Aquibium sp. A9E412 TaxID=2976767 RepID=UPI0025AFEEB2|nr:isochorismatase family protein [Aquibium sp. A9E412]MDN2568320.1 isochorismatase family protein [Aquibium sp. A9E412]
MSDAYQAAGYQAGQRIGFGDKPGVVVVDFQTAFTDPQFPLGRSPMIHGAVDQTVKLLKAARAAGAPVANVYTAYSSARDAPYWKIPTVVNDFHHGKPGTELDPRIHDAGYDAVFCKTGPSVFFQTAIVSYFAKERVDTVFVVGCTTSGCIRASVIDAFSYGYRVMVPEPCVGDMDEGPHRDNLRDVGRRYCDVLALDESLDYLEQVRRRNDR